MSNYDEQDLERLAAIFKALSNPSRLRIFLRLRACCGPGRILLPGEEANCCVGEVSQDLTISPSTVSHHLKELRQAGLISVRRKGQKSECRLNQEALAQLAQFLKG
ncbi:MAG: helix-turn-helix transcriptional regulator [Desulfarculus sp.]|nr:helix-turn-helix transcriptional regulator [Desulfarculus sp.]